MITYAQIVFDVNIQDISVVTDWQPIPPAEIDALQRWGAISTTELQPNRLASSALSKKPTAVVEQWKILVNEEGIYQITGQDLANAGVDLLAIDFKKIRLVNNGRDVSLFPSGWRDGQFDPEDYIEFWGEPNRQTFQATAADMYQDPFSTERVYWLSWEKRGLWMAEESGEISDLQPGQYVRPYSFLETLHVEKDDYYDRLSAVPIDSLRDHWFYDSGVASGKKVDYEFVLDHPDTQSPLSVSARVMFSGRTTIVNIPHDVSVFLNDTFLFSNKWFGQELADLQTKADAPIISGELNDGVNRLSVVNNVLPQNYDFFMLNWFEITYPRLYRTSNDYIKFSIPPGMPAGKFLFRIDGFQNSEIDIYKLHQSKINGGMIEKVTDFNNFTSQQVSFQNDVFSPEVEFVAVAQNAKKKPFKIEKDNPTILKTTSLAADYLIITHRRFMKSASLQQLVSLRQSQGLQALVADVQDVYDEFNFGQPGSYAIKDFLKWAFDYWQAPRLRYVLLIGDGCYTRYTATGDTLDLVPVHMRQTMVYGAAASDFWYSLLTGDDEIPEVSIGRLPVRSEDELNRFVTKIVQYETNPPPGDWQNRLLIIGGNGGDFRSQGIALSKTIPLPFNTRMLFTVRDQSQEDPYFGGTSDLLDYFDLGCNVITFHGHGGGAIWADNGLLRFEDGNRIYTGGKSPFVLSMTCFTGSFESPGVESLADALLFSTFEGAIAMLGASGVGWTWNDYFLQTELMKQICAFPQLTLGEQLMAGKISYQVHYKTSQAVSQINQYHLLGDPATRLHLPQAVRPVIVDKTISLKGDTLTATCKLPFSRGEAVFDLEDSLRIVANSRTSAVIDSVATAKLFVSEDFAGKSGLVRFFGADETNRYKNHGAAPISLQGAVFDSAYVYRAQDDSLYFLAHVRSRNTIKSVWCYALNDSIIMNPIGDDWYRSSHAVFIIWSGFQFSYYFNAYDEANFRYTSRLYKHYINLNVDVEINENAVSLAGDEMVSLLASIQNKSSNPVNDLLVLFETRVLPDTTWRGAGVDTVSIEAFATTTCRVNYAPPPQDFLVRVTLDPDSTIREDSKQNNQMVQQITPHLFQVTPQGFYVQGQYQTTFRYDDYLSIELPVGAIPHYSAVLIEEMSALKINEQPDFYSPKVTPAYDLQLRSDYLLEKPAIVRLLLPHDSSITDSTRQLWKIFRFAKQTKKWVRCDTQLLENNLVTQLNVVGPLSVLVAQDSQSPDVFVSVDGQPYVDHKWAGDEPRIGIRLQ
ncbi:MAG: hypothetical protein EHM72_11370, partial [Calditrichaeota bacterium]